MAPKAKGSGEAEAYWEEFRSHLVPNEILYGLVRIVMGDAESRRPKFVFVIWLGRQCSVMQKAPAEKPSATTFRCPARARIMSLKFA